MQIFLERERSAAADENETELKCLKSSFFVFRPNFFEKMIFKLSALVSCSWFAYWPKMKSWLLLDLLFKIWANSGLFLFTFVLFKSTIQIWIEKSVDIVLGIRTRDYRMEGADGSTELCISIFFASSISQCRPSMDEVLLYPIKREVKGRIGLHDSSGYYDD